MKRNEGAQRRKGAYRYICNVVPRCFASVRLGASLLRFAFRDGGVNGLVKNWGTMNVPRHNHLASDWKERLKRDFPTGQLPALI